MRWNVLVDLSNAQVGFLIKLKSIIDKGAILSKFKCLQNTEIEKVSFHYWLKKKMHAQSKINPLKLTSHKAKLSYWHQNILSSSVLVL